MIWQPQTGLLFEKEQFRACRLQVYNWGTFSELHDVPISERGFLFVGRSGSGKTTLLDAISALLVPPRWIDFNAAAHEADRGGRDRNLVSYIRGAWSARKDGESGEIAASYLRKGTTWSALALSYRNASGYNVSVVQVFWLRGNDNGNTDVKRYYMVFERAFDLRELEDFGKSNLDIRKLKLSFPDTFIRGDFRSYCEHFCRLLGIESEMALRLLHKTQSAKNLGDLNSFLREFMLDKPETFEVAGRLVSEFGELNAAHQAVVTARQQIETLVPAREKHQHMESLTLQKNSLEELQTGIKCYRETRRMDLLREHINALTIDAEGLEGETARRQELLDNHTNALRDLERRHRDIGGDRIEECENELRTLEEQRKERLHRRDQAEAACGELGWTLGETPQGFAELVGKARGEIESWENRNNAALNERLKVESEKKEAENAFAIAVREVKALQSQASNIPAEMLELRAEIASAIGISDSALPFAGELIEVKPDERSWQGAIERILRGFALSILVDERDYPALSNYINNTNLGRRLVYYRAGRIESWQAKPLNADSMMLKLKVKECNYEEWLKTELRNRFDYACVESIQAFRAADRALTREGQVKHSKTRHEKDDRRAVNDRRAWVLGFDNQEKLTLFKEQAKEQATIISTLQGKIDLLSDQQAKSMSRAMNSKTLVNLQWQEIDIVPLIERIHAVEKLISETREGNTELQEIARRIHEQKSLVSQADHDLRNARISRDKTLEQIRKHEGELDERKNDPSIVSPTPYQKTNLDERYERITRQQGGNIRLDNLDRVTTDVVEALGKDVEKNKLEIADCRKLIENVFADFKRSWAMDSGDLDSTLSSAPDFFAKLARLETDGLPAHEQRFFELLQNQSNQNLAALSTYLTDARKAILERMEYVNESLRQVPFNQSENQRTYLRIDASDRQLPEVREFKQEIQQALSHAMSGEREYAETRFLALRGLVERLSSQESEQKRWREAVLDVRQHVEFIGRENDEEGVEIEIYRSGAGKSGGQRQKLATTCLAAALRYQLGGNDHGVPMYAPVVLDEAFDKADNEFTALAMNIFNNFGFQMIVATPLRSVMTLEPFIGGACFVDISDRRVSGVLNIEYDNDRNRLNLPDQAREETGDKETDIEIS